MSFGFGGGGFGQSNNQSSGFGTGSGFGSSNTAGGRSSLSLCSVISILAWRFIFSIPLCFSALPSVALSRLLRSVGNNPVLPDFDPRWTMTRARPPTSRLDKPQSCQTKTPADSLDAQRRRDNGNGLVEGACLKNQSLTAIPAPSSRLRLRLRINNLRVWRW